MSPIVPFVGAPIFAGLPAHKRESQAALERLESLLEAANKRIAELEAELDAARRWYRL